MKKFLQIARIVSNFGLLGLGMGFLFVGQLQLSTNIFSFLAASYVVFHQDY